MSDFVRFVGIAGLDLSDLSNLPISAIQNSARGTDGLTDRPSYRDAWTHLKTMYISHCSFVLLLSFSQSLHRAGLTFDKILRTKEQLGGRRSGVQGPELRDTLGHVRHIFCVCLTLLCDSMVKLILIKHRQQSEKPLGLFRYSSLI